MAIVSLDIIPQSETVDLFDEENTIPNDNYLLAGHIELSLTRPVHVREIAVQFHGFVRSAISMDYPEQKMWNHTEPELQILMDRARRRATGIAEASQVLIQERTIVLDQPTLLRAGTSRWSFEIHLKDVQSLPPSLLLPRHTIRYELSAYIKLTSLRERVKIGYWNVRSKAARRVSVAYRRLSNTMLPVQHLSTPSPSSSSSSSPPPLVVVTGERCQKKQKNRLLSASRPIEVRKHSHASLQAFSCIPRVRYRGARPDRIRYHVSTVKFACLQQRLLNVTCDFFPLHPDASISFLELSLEQTEVYPSSERKMSLSFPVKMGTVPASRPSQMIRHSIATTTDGFELEEEPEQEGEELHKLPSYHDVLYEGAPPCPFLEENEPAPMYVR
ncbi:hypothetical protein EC973_001499 [Apophysomyces ossiformis]|uniref:Arrestin-like N-terminal domain-containing protein n=1 Tax=Apophysomyces ossiformis TaxID=679940 RepID=A0A8H7BPX1_9FUNG|nr:hypothetical protein EC973_001499 [Apophysomyces ossiformis]